MTPANTFLYGAATNVKLKAVTAGQTFQLFFQLTGTVSMTLCLASFSVLPVNKLCMPKKYVLKIGVKTVWLMPILTARDTMCEE